MNDVPEFYELRFDWIQWELEESSNLYLTQIYKRLIMLGLPDNVFVNVHSRLVYEYLRYDSLKNYIIPYVDYIENVGEHKYTEKIGSIEISTENIQKDVLKSTNWYINELIIRDRAALDYMFNHTIKLHPFILKSLKSIYFKEIPLPWVILGTQWFESVRPIEEFRVYFKKQTDLSLGLFDYIQKVQSKVHWTSIEFNYESHSVPTITKLFPRIVYKEGSKLKVIKAGKMYLQISDDREEVIYK